MFKPVFFLLGRALPFVKSVRSAFFPSASAPAVQGGIAQHFRISAAIILLLCVLPLLLMQCSRSNLERLRDKHRRLEAEYQVLQFSLRECREASSLQNMVLLQHDLQSRAIANKYNKLRETTVRALLPLKENTKNVDELTYNKWAPSVAEEAFTAQQNSLYKSDLYDDPVFLPAGAEVLERAEPALSLGEGQLQGVMAKRPTGKVATATKEPAEEQYALQVWGAQPVPEFVRRLLGEAAGASNLPYTAPAVAYEHSGSFITP